MTIEIILAFFAFVLLIFGAFKGATSEKAKKLATIITIIGFIVFILSSFNFYKKADKLRSKTVKIDSLLRSLEVSSDSVSVLRSSLEGAIDELETVNASYSQLQHQINRTKYPFYNQRIEIDDGQVLILDGLLQEGMRIKITGSNCNHSVAFIHNQKRQLIKEDISGLWSTMILENTGIDKSFFKNEGNAPCGMVIEIFSSENSLESQESEIGFKVKVEEELHIDPATIDCVFEDIIFSGTWQMIMDYSDCVSKTKIEWSKLTTYFSISEFSNTNDVYVLRGNKFAENYRGKYLKYSKDFPLKSDKGSMKDCVITIPIDAEYGDGKISEGFIKLLDLENIQGQNIITGDFFTKTNSCRGKITLISN